MDDWKVLYEDNHIIAVFKPAGILVQPEDVKEKSLYSEVKKYLKEKYKKPGNVFLGIVHRLDRPVAGIVLFGKTSKGASRLSEQFRNKKIQKIYYCLVEGQLKEKQGILKDILEKNKTINKSKVSDIGKLAILKYKTIKTNKKVSLLEIELLTGKSHQIRAQLANKGNPILGDKKYGAKARFLKNSIALFAGKISFQLATKEEIKNLVICIPKEWNNYLK